MDTQLTATEVQMFNEVFQIFSKYKDLTRKFGLQLSHSHFNLMDGEVLHETHNKDKRSIYIAPIPIHKLSAESISTSWNFSDEGKPVVSLMCCDS